MGKIKIKKLLIADKSLDTLFDQVGMRVQHDPWSIHLASFK